MKFPRILFFVAFVVGLPSVRAASALHLSEIGVTRFVERSPGEIWVEHGLLSALGAFRVTEQQPALASVPIPPEARNRLLIQLEAWLAYGRLGAEALVNFVANPDDAPVSVAARQYLPVSVSPNPILNEGRLVNVSTRGRASATEKLIGGFVVDEQHRWVLIRAVGPGLSPLGVTDAMRDPFLVLYKGQTPFLFNGDWSTRPDAADITAAARRAGAFPLQDGSKDAALLVELPPGAYTAHIEPESGEGGTVLLEVYTLPSA